MKYSAQCVRCTIDKQFDKIKALDDENLKFEFMKSVCRIIADSDDSITAPMISAKVSEISKRFFGDTHEYAQEKETYNSLMLSLESDIRDSLDKSGDRLKSAILYAMAGNYIDFGAVSNFQRETLIELLSSSQNNSLPYEDYSKLKSDLKTAEKLVYITDNCGEIVMDKLLIQTIAKLYPHIKINAIVRGGEVINDADINDARFVGLTDIVDVTPNGTLIPGTQLDEINDESRTLIQNADIIIAKGQGNFESLNGCGLNIYYLFLCKCEWFVRRFNMPQNSGVFVHENNISIQ